jgi:hypothetical protein
VTVTPVERIAPDDPAKYTIAFLSDSSVAAQIDCNRGFGRYHIDGKAIRIGPLASTRMGCPPGSLRYHIRSNSCDAAPRWFTQSDTLHDRPSGRFGHSCGVVK